MGHYCAAKAGLGQLTKVAAAEFGPHGIRVNVVAPGLIRTPLVEAMGLSSGHNGEQFIQRTPLGRLGETDDVAPVVSFLCSEDARWITGETILVDGGNHIRGVQSYAEFLSRGA